MRASASVDNETNELGSLYVQFSERPIAKTVPVRNPDDPEMLIDVTDKNEIVGIEVLSAALLRGICEAVAKRMPRQYKDQVTELCEA